MNRIIISIIVFSIFIIGCNKEEDEVIDLRPDAGASFIDIENDGYVVTLTARAALKGQTGTWIVYEGDYGRFDNIHDPKTKFYGEPGEVYQIGWEISVGKQYEASVISVSFKAMSPKLITSVQDTIHNNVSLFLKAKEAKFGAEGKWEIVTGDGGRIEDANSNNAIFIGKQFKEYVVRWKLTYGSKEEFLDLSFTTDELIANAGEDNLDINIPKDLEKYYSLDAYYPAGATVSWSIVQGGNGMVYNMDNANSLFEGIPDEEYQLIWKVQVDDYVSTDSLNLRFRGKWGLWTDPRDKQTYKFAEVNGIEWMAENYNYPQEPGTGSWYYGQSDRAVVNGGYPLETDEDRKLYGRLYTWHAASRATPVGWRLPTVEEVDDLENYLGGPLYALDKIVLGGETGIDLNYGGYYDIISSQDPAFRNVFSNMDGFGVYWTNNYNENQDSATVEIVQNEGDFLSENLLSASYNAASVRYVRDVQD